MHVKQYEHKNRSSEFKFGRIQIHWLSWLTESHLAFVVDHLYILFSCVQFNSIVPSTFCLTLDHCPFLYHWHWIWRENGHLANPV